MAQPVKPLEHVDPERKSDEALRSEARAHLAATPPLQLVAELLTKLRTLDLPWWKPEMLRERWSSTERMRWYRARPDLRQKITSTLTGLQPKAARKKAPDFQGGLIDSVIDEGDVNARAFEECFDPADLVVYGPVEAFWGAFIEKMPWKQDTSIHQELIAWLFDALLADHSAIESMSRKPILTAWDARTAIDGRVWHTRMPLEIRVAIDDARFRKQRERPNEPFHAASDLSIAVATTIAVSIPLRDLAPVFAAAERIMGFSSLKPGGGPEAKKVDGAVDGGASAAKAVAAPASAEGAPKAVAAPGASAPVASVPPPAASVPVASAPVASAPVASAPVASVPPPAASAPGASSVAAIPAATAVAATPLPAATPSVPPPARPTDSLPPARPSVAPPVNAAVSPSIPPPAAVPAEAKALAPPAAPVPPSPPAQPLPARALSTPPPAQAQPAQAQAQPVQSQPVQSQPVQPPPARSLSTPSTPPPAVEAPRGVPAATTLAARPVAAPIERSTGTGAIPVAAAIRADFASASTAAPVKPEGLPKPAPTTSPRAMAATLIDALAHIPVEDERTNPWDIPSEDSIADGDDTGVIAPARRDDAAGSGKRKRSGKG